MAERSGVPLATVNNYVRGRHGMKMKTLAALAAASDVTLEWIISGNKPSVPDATPRMPEPPTSLNDAGQAPPPVPAGHASAPDGQVPAPPSGGIDVAILAKAIDIVRGIAGTTALNDRSPELAQRIAAVYAVLMQSAPTLGS